MTPFIASLAALTLALPLLLVRLERRRTKEREEVLGPRWRTLCGRRSSALTRRRSWLRSAAVFLILVAALRPQWGEGSAPAATQGCDLVVCLDVSRSMLAQDLLPNRLERAKAELRTLLASAGGDRLGLVIFAGEARLLSPLTTDHVALEQLLDRATPDAPIPGGSDLAAALRLADASLPKEGTRPASVLLLSDGEDRDGSAAAAAATLRQRDVDVHCVGFASVIGAKIPWTGPNGRGFLKDARGREVLTRLDAESLETIATEGAGSFQVATTESAALRRLLEVEIHPRARMIQETRSASTPRERYQWPLALALLFLLAEIAGSWRRRP